MNHDLSFSEFKNAIGKEISSQSNKTAQYILFPNGSLMSCEKLRDSQEVIVILTLFPCFCVVFLPKAFRKFIILLIFQLPLMCSHVQALD